MVLDALEYFEYSIFGDITGDTIEPKLIERGIKYLGGRVEEEKKYVPFEGGYLHEEDERYIKENDIKAMEVAKYTDGWFSCLPLPEIYQMYNQDEMKRDYLDILHQSMFARVSDKEYVGSWSLLLGNIPNFLKVCDVEIEWKTIFDIFKQFLEVSLIYFPDKQN